jgi:hypothetical protein
MYPDTVASSPLYFGAAAVPATSGNGSQLQYSPLVTYSGTFYHVGCTGIALNGRNIPSIPESAFDIHEDGSGGLIFDSGTTYTALWVNMYNPLTDAIKQQLTGSIADITKRSGFTLCYAAQWNDWINDKSLPAISFQLANTTGFNLAVDTAWIKLDDSTVCLAMQSISSRTSFLGSYQQVGYHILYDQQNEQIGFMKAECTTTNTGQLLLSSNSNRSTDTLRSALYSGLLVLLFILMLAP